MSRSEAKKKKILSCPTCRRTVTAKDPDFPFCSDRCRIIDLGKWASGEYRISSPALDPELLEELDHELKQEAERTGKPSSSGDESW
jgi:endogenous inhibitor of DNA gyrase (YacG/DUF329 family)